MESVAGTQPLFPPSEFTLRAQAVLSEGERVDHLGWIGWKLGRCPNPEQFEQEFAFFIGRGWNVVAPMLRETFNRRLRYHQLFVERPYR